MYIKTKNCTLSLAFDESEYQMIKYYPWANFIRKGCKNYDLLPYFSSRHLISDIWGLNLPFYIGSKEKIYKELQNKIITSYTFNFIAHNVH